MKKIAVLVEDLSVDYSIGIVHGICDYYKDKNIHLTLFPIKRPFSPEGDYSYQFWNGTKFAATDSFDACIVISGGFLSFMKPEDLGENLNVISDKKLVSVAIPIPDRKIAYTFSDCGNTYKTVVKHLMEKHGCKKIAFNSGNLSGSPEAFERFESYKAALKANGLEYDENLVVHSDFLYKTSYALYKEKYKSKSDVDFDAVLCASDLMAYGCIEALGEIGIKVPEDLKVFGFDDIERARRVSPTLSTINQQTYEQGTLAAELALKIAEGKKVEIANQVETDARFRQSCGCAPLDQKDTVSDLMELNKSLTMNEIIDAGVFQATVNYFLDCMQKTETLENFYKKLDDLFSSSEFESISICFFDEPLLLDQKQPFKIPNRIELAGIAEKDRTYGHSCSYTFNPNKQILPEDILASNEGVYLFHPIYNGKKFYGYIYCRVSKRSFYQHHIYLKIFAYGLTSAYEFSKTLEKNKDLSIQNELLQLKNSKLDLKSRTDDLTKILNRRGIMEKGQNIIDFALGMKQTGVVIFGDMNGLKSINDNYGHEMGDKAIQAQAEILTSVFRSSDVIGRLGGDEFVAVIPGMNVEQVKDLTKKLSKISKTISAKRELPFEISISLGAVNFNEENSSLQKLIKEADTKQYEAKRRYHAEQKN